MLKKMWIKLFPVMGLVMLAAPALAAESYAGGESINKGLIALAAGLAISIAAAGGALGQSKGVAAALEGIARNPSASGKLVTPMIIGLALIESLVIYSLIVSLLMVFKL